jgi:hypothetical protein
MAIVVFRGLLGEDEDHSVIGNDPAFRRLGAESKIFKFRLAPDESFESAILGHSDIVLDQGPLTVAALGWNPPERSLHFHLSLMSLNYDAIRSVVLPPSPEEILVLERQLLHLNTKNLTVLVGEGLDHALVCEKRIDIRTTSPSEAVKKGLAASLPEGDGENELRRFIDDSVNLLTEEEFNARRMDMGILPINLCLPWGQGERQRVPNLALELGYPWVVRSNSFALRGLAKLSGLRCEKLADFTQLSSLIQGEPKSLAVLDCSSRPVSEEESEIFGRRIAEIGTKLVEPLLDWSREAKSDLCFVATNGRNEGLIGFRAKENEQDHFPFDERSLTERWVEEMKLGLVWWQPGSRD